MAAPSEPWAPRSSAVDGPVGAGFDPDARDSAGAAGLPGRSPGLPAAGDIKLGDLEVEVMRQTVQALGGNISEAAKRLGVSRNTIYRKLRWNAPAPD